MMLEHQQLLAQKQEVERMLAMREQRVGATPGARGREGGVTAGAVAGSGGHGGGFARTSAGIHCGARTGSSASMEDVADEFRGAF